MYQNRAVSNPKCNSPATSKDERAPIPAKRQDAAFEPIGDLFPGDRTDYWLFFGRMGTSRNLPHAPSP